MSKITLTPNAAGTGTFTLASPNSNTNRTLTLPDSAGELLTSGSTLSSANLTGALPAIDGSSLTGLTAGASVQDVNTLWLEVAQTSNRVTNMIDGVVDSYGASTGVDTLLSTSLSFAGSGNITRTSGSLLTPTSMTSNTAPTPYVASLSNSATTAYELFDGTTSYEETPTGGWAKIDLGTSAEVSSYSMTAGVNTTTYSWKSWTFQGSNNDSTWTTLDTQTNYVWTVAIGVPVVFSCTAGTYRYLRWSPTANGGVAAYSQELAAYETPPAVLSYTVISNASTADAVPTSAVVGVQATGTNTLNTDLIVYASRDDGTTWTAGTLAQVYTVAGGVIYYESAEIDISGQPSGTTMRYKVYADSDFVTEINATLFKWG